MPVSHTNRKGITFFLCQGETRTGKVRFYFAREPKGKKIEQTPSGYEISESVNGVVSLVKIRPRLIPTEESTLVEEVLKRHPGGDNYRVYVKRDQIVIYEEAGPDAERILALFGNAIPHPAGAIERLKAHMEQHRRFTPVMRFILSDPQTRMYSAQRWCYLGSIDDWIRVGSPGKLRHLARQLVPTLGTDEFFELY
jgi:hypothetical protein